MNIGFSSRHAASAPRPPPHPSTPPAACTGRHHMLELPAPRFHLNSPQPSLFQPPQLLHKVWDFLFTRRQTSKTRDGKQKQRRRTFLSSIFKKKWLAGAEEACDPPTGPLTSHLKRQPASAEGGSVFSRRKGQGVRGAAR